MSNKIKDIKIGIIGFGHIGHALFDGLLRNKFLSSDNFILTNPNIDKIRRLIKTNKPMVTTNNTLAVQKSDVIVIAVKPKVVKSVITEIKAYLSRQKIVVSVAACVSLDLLNRYSSSDENKFIRIMPNIPVAYGIGVIGWVANKRVMKKDKIMFNKMFSSLGLLVRCRNEEMLDRLSLISGCGSGYVAYFMENLKKISKQYGFDKSLAQKIVLATFTGTIQHLRATKLEFNDFVQEVATKGGITEEVIRNMEKYNFYSIFNTSVEKGYNKIKKISNEL